MKRISAAPAYLIDQTRMGSYRPQSSWDYDLRGTGEVPDTASSRFGQNLKSVNTDYPTVYKREINVREHGVLTLECDLGVTSGEGFFMGFYGGKDHDAEAFRMTYRGGFMTARGKKLFPFGEGVHAFKAEVDLDRAFVRLFLDGAFAAECAFTGKAASIANLRFGFDKEDVGEAFLGQKIKLYENFLFNDTCFSEIAGDFGADYDVTVKRGDVKAAYAPYGGRRPDYVRVLEAKGPSETVVARRFARTKAAVVLQLKYLVPACGAKVTVSPLCGDEQALALTDGGDALCFDGKALRRHSANVWQTLRIEADPADGTALIRLNGKKVTTLPLAADCIDGLSVVFETEGEAKLTLADLYAYVTPPKPKDYPTPPVRPKKKGDYYVGMNICSLWREGSHYGWDPIVPFAENKPLLGWYDEGVAETADWELKWMAENGVDFQLYCWYPSEFNVPMIRTSLSSAIHDGHMLADYGDSVKMALLWEASGCGGMTRDDFRNVFVPYWMDYFFDDNRYMRIDGLAVMTVYNPQRLVQAFGSAAALKEELDYLRAEVKKHGYDGMIITCNSTVNGPFYKECGFDAIHAYNNGYKSYDPDFTKGLITTAMAEGSVHVVPTVSVGYNVVAWLDERYPMMTSEDMRDTLIWARDEILPRYDRDSWQSKLVMLSTWNEYGEGTYICPSEGNGFGYLNAVRSAFYEDVPHIDVAPDEKQKARIGTLYPSYRGGIAPLEKLPRTTENYTVYKRYTFASEAELALWEPHGFETLAIKDGRLVATVKEQNPYLVLKDASFLPFPAYKVASVRARIRCSKPVGQADCIQIGFSNAPDGKIAGAVGYCLTDPNKVTELEIDVTRLKNAEWGGEITGFRFDPIWGEGEFELVDVSFMSQPAHLELFIDGEAVKPARYPFIDESGAAVIPFDTRSALVKRAGLYYEWHECDRSLHLFGKADAVFYENRDVALVGGKPVKLGRPVTLYDGMPLIEAGLLAEVLGKKAKVTAEAVEIG